MIVKLLWNTEQTFAHLVEGSRSFCEARSLGGALEEMFRQVKIDVVRTTRVERDVPTKLMLMVSLEVIDADAEELFFGTPPALFQEEPIAAKLTKLNRKRKEEKHGKS